MPDSDQADASLTAEGEVAAVQATAALSLLGDETRVQILQALWEAYEPPLAQTSPVSFSELFDRVSAHDSGQFNYHLDKLRDHYIRKTNDGYKLRPFGLKLIQTVIGGVGRDVTLERSEIDVPCPLCDGGTAITYYDGRLYHFCTDCEGGGSGREGAPDGMLFAEQLQPAGLSNRTPEEVFAAGRFGLNQIQTLLAGGLCPRCSGVVETSVNVCDDHTLTDDGGCSACGNRSKIRVQWICSVCKNDGFSSPKGVVLFHPAVIGFYHDHGIAVGGYTSNDFETSKQFRVFDHEQELVSRDPLRILVTVRYDDDELRLVLDQGLNVVEITENR